MQFGVITLIIKVAWFKPNENNNYYNLIIYLFWWWGPLTF